MKDIQARITAGVACEREEKQMTLMQHIILFSSDVSIFEIHTQGNNAI